MEFMQFPIFQHSEPWFQYTAAACTVSELVHMSVFGIKNNNISSIRSRYCSANVTYCLGIWHFSRTPDELFCPEKKLNKDCKCRKELFR